VLFRSLLPVIGPKKGENVFVLFFLNSRHLHVGIFYAEAVILTVESDNRNVNISCTQKK